MARRVSVDVERPADESLPEASDIRRWIETALNEGGVQRGRDVAVAVAIVDTAVMHDLNARFRHRDGPTNVLSFPAGDIAGMPDGGARPLGDVVLCADVIRQEAENASRPSEHHWAHLCVHGALHLGGYDHIRADEAREMESLEVRILDRLGIPDPYGSG